MKSMAAFPALTPKVVLGIAAHPDDLDFGASGTMAVFAAQGATVHYLLLTDGSKGSADYGLSAVELIKTRQTEQRAALEAIGGQGKHVHFLEYPDGELEVTMELKRDVVKAIRTIRPEVVVTMDPGVLYAAERGMINHPDHRAAGQAALDAVYPLARDHLSFPELFAEGYEPHKVSTVLLINFERSNFYVDITPTIDQKLAALAAHPSQMPDLAHTQQFMRDVAASAGKAAGYTYAEGFVRIDVRG